MTLGSTLHKCSGPVYPKVVLAGQTSRGCCLYVCKRRKRRISLSLCASSESERREFLLLGEYEKAKQTTNNNNNRLSEWLSDCLNGACGTATERKKQNLEKG